MDKDLTYEKPKEPSNAHSLLLFQSNKNSINYLGSSTDDDLTPWSDDIAPVSFFSNNQRKLSKPSIEPKKQHSVIENVVSFRGSRKRERPAGFHSNKISTESNKEIDNSEDVSASTSLQSVPINKSPILVSQSTRKSHNSMTPISPMLSAHIIPEKIPIVKPVEIVGNNLSRRLSPRAQYAPSSYFPALANDYKRGMMIQKELAARSNKFWLDQSRFGRSGNEDITLQDLERMYNSTHTNKNQNIGRQDVTMPNLESFRQDMLSRKEAKKKEILEPKALSGVKTELNDFKKKLSAFGLYNLEKKNKLVEEKLVKMKNEPENTEPVNTNLKLKLEILKKMTKDGQETTKGKRKSRENVDKQVRLFIGPGNQSVNKIGIEEEPFSIHQILQDQGFELPKGMMFSSLNPETAGREEFLHFEDFSKRLVTESDNEKSLQQQDFKSKMEQNKSFEMLKKMTKSPDPHSEAFIVRNPRNPSYERMRMPLFGVNMENKLINSGTVELIKSGIYQSQKSQDRGAPKKSRNRTYIKCSLSPQDLTSLRDVLKVGGVEKP